MKGEVRLTPNGLAESDALRGGRNENQWRQSFRNLQARLEAIQEEVERTPPSRTRKIDRLEDKRRELLRQLARLESEADQARVPYRWRE